MENEEIILKIESKKGLPTIHMSLNKFILTDQALSTFSESDLMDLSRIIGYKLKNFKEEK